MEIQAKGIFDYDSIKALTYVSIYKKKNPRKYFIWMNIGCIGLALLILAEMILFGVDRQSIMLIIVDVMLILLNFYMYFGFPKIQYNALHLMKNTENTYIFQESKIKVFSKGAQYTGEAELQYSMIPKVMETKKYLFIFQSKNQAYVVDKATIVNGTIEDVRAKLHQSSKSKYIVCRY